MLNKSFITQLKFSQIVMATFLGHRLTSVREMAGAAVAFVWQADSLKLHNYLKKKSLYKEAVLFAELWANDSDDAPDWIETL